MLTFSSKMNEEWLNLLISKILYTKIIWLILHAVHVTNNFASLYMT